MSAREAGLTKAFEWILETILLSRQVLFELNTNELKIQAIMYHTIMYTDSITLWRVLINTEQEYTYHHHHGLHRAPPRHVDHVSQLSRPQTEERGPGEVRRRVLC